MANEYMKMKYILVVEDHSITRRGLCNYLSSAFPEFEIQEARNGRDAVDQVAAQQPDVIIMDMVMPRMDGGTAAEEIKLHWPEVKILLLLLETEQGHRALESGADAYLLKYGDPGELVKVLGDLGITSVEADSLNS
jgi:CheY-like chemotaxis protein